MALDMPKSLILTLSSFTTSTFLAARSRWTNLTCSRYSIPYDSMMVIVCKWLGLGAVANWTKLHAGGSYCINEPYLSENVKQITRHLVKPNVYMYMFPASQQNSYCNSMTIPKLWKEYPLVYFTTWQWTCMKVQELITYKTAYRSNLYHHNHDLVDSKWTVEWKENKKLHEYAHNNNSCLCIIISWGTIFLVCTTMSS